MIKAHKLHLASDRIACSKGHRQPIPPLDPLRRLLGDAEPAVYGGLIGHRLGREMGWRASLRRIAVHRRELVAAAALDGVISG